MPQDAAHQTPAPEWGAPLLIVPMSGASPSTVSAFLCGLGYSVVPAHPASADSPSDPARVTDAGLAVGPGSIRLPGRLEVSVASLPHSPMIAASLQAASVRPLLLIRDPRDALASQIGRTAGAAIPEGAPGAAAGVPDSVHQDAGTAASDVLRAQLADLRPWREHPGVVLIRYEDVCPSRLGGDEARQIETLAELAAALGWRGSVFTLARSILGTHADDGTDDQRARIGVSQAHEVHAAVVSAGAALRDEIAAWGYPVESQPALPVAQGAIGGLLAALANEHENVRDDLMQRAVAARREQHLVEDGARLLQARLAAERARFAPVRRGFSLLAMVRRLAGRLAKTFRTVPAERTAHPSEPS